MLRPHFKSPAVYWLYLLRSSLHGLCEWNIPRCQSSWSCELLLRYSRRRLMRTTNPRGVWGDAQLHIHPLHPLSQSSTNKHPDFLKFNLNWCLSEIVEIDFLNLQRNLFHSGLVRNCYTYIFFVDSSRYPCVRRCLWSLELRYGSRWEWFYFPRSCISFYRLENLYVALTRIIKSNCSENLHLRIWKFQFTNLWHILHVHVITLRIMRNSWFI